MAGAGRKSVSAVVFGCKVTKKKRGMGKNIHISKVKIKFLSMPGSTAGVWAGRPQPSVKPNASTLNLTPGHPPMALAQAITVAPVVTTSSTIRMCLPASAWRGSA